MDIGIIGGSDGPTSIYVASDSMLPIISAAALICIAAILIIRRVKKRKR